MKKIPAFIIMFLFCVMAAKAQTASKQNITPAIVPAQTNIQQPQAANAAGIAKKMARAKEPQFETIPVTGNNGKKAVARTKQSAQQQAAEGKTAQATDASQGIPGTRVPVPSPPNP